MAIGAGVFGGPGWDALQIEQIHDQLRQGWPLELAETNVAALSGHCPLRARRGG